MTHATINANIRQIRRALCLHGWREVTLRDASRALHDCDYIAFLGGILTNDASASHVRETLRAAGFYVAGAATVTLAAWSKHTAQAVCDYVNASLASTLARPDNGAPWVLVDFASPISARRANVLVNSAARD